MANFAVIKTGGKQYVVAPGDIIRIEKLSKAGKELKKGDTVTFDEVLLVGSDSDFKVGTPHVSGAKVQGELLEEGKGKKLTIIKFKSKTRFRKKQGHRQLYAKVKVSSIIS